MGKIIFIIQKLIFRVFKINSIKEGVTSVNYPVHVSIKFILFNPTQPVKIN